MTQYKKDKFYTTAIVGIIIICALVMSFILPPISRADKSEYPLEYDANFIAACLEGGSNVYGCVCPLNHVKDNYSYPEALKLDEQFTKTETLPDGLQQVFKDCQGNK